MEIRYQIFEDENLLIHRFIGEFSLEKYISYMKNMTESFVSNSISKVIVDLRNMSVKGNPTKESDTFLKNIEKLANARKHLDENDFKGKEVTLAFWVDKPVPTVVAQLFIKRLSKSNYFYCSTEEKIVTVLDLPTAYKNLNQLSDNLENAFEG